MTPITTTADDYAKLIKGYKAPNQRESLWEQFLTGTQQQYQSATQQVQAATSYDISGAYANYKQQQLQLMMNNQLGAGFKEHVGSGLQQQYETAYDNLKTQEYSALAALVEKQATAINKVDSEIAKKGVFAKKLETAIYDFAAKNKAVLGYDLSNVENIYKSVDEGGLGFYKVDKDEEGNVTYELTDYGKDFYDKILHSPSTALKFQQYLKDEELLDDYMKDVDFYNSIIGGLEYGDRSYSTSERIKELRDKKLQGSHNIDDFVDSVVDRIHFQKNDSFTLFGNTPNVKEGTKYVGNNVDALKKYYNALNINPDYAKQDLQKVSNKMRKWFNSYGMSDASLQKKQFKKYLTEVINSRLDS